MDITYCFEGIRPGNLSSITYFTLAVNRVRMTDSIVQAQPRNFEQDLMNPTEFQAIEERLLYEGSPLPDLEVHFSKIDVRKPPQDGKEWYQTLLQFRPTGTPTRETRMALGNQLMAKLSLWNLLYTNKPRLDLAISNTKGRILVHVANIKLHPPCFQQALIYHYVNQGIMDQIADTLLKAASTHFNIHMTMHEE